MRMADNDRRAAQRARRDQHLRDVETSHKNAADLLAKSRGEVARSRRLVREADEARAARDTEDRNPEET